MNQQVLKHSIKKSIEFHLSHFNKCYQNTKYVDQMIFQLITSYLPTSAQLDTALINALDNYDIDLAAYLVSQGANADNYFAQLEKENRYHSLCDFIDLEFGN